MEACGSDELPGVFVGEDAAGCEDTGGGTCGVVGRGGMRMWFGDGAARVRCWAGVAERGDDACELREL